MTKKARGLRTEVVFTRADGMHVDSVANLDDIITVPATLLDRLITKASDGKMNAVRGAIIFALDL